MTVDTSRLKRRKGLGAPPTDGTPGLESGPTLQDQIADEPGKPPSTRDAALPVNTSEGSGSEAARLPGFASLPQLISDLATVNDAVPMLTKTTRIRVPLAEEESRVPFTTRVTVSTKERLENACYHLRKRHQEFVSEAIAAHLEKHGF